MRDFPGIDLVNLFPDIAFFFKSPYPAVLFLGPCFSAVLGIAVFQLGSRFCAATGPINDAAFKVSAGNETSVIVKHGDILAFSDFAQIAHGDDPAEIADFFEFRPGIAVILGNGHPNRIKARKEDQTAFAGSIIDLINRRRFQSGRKTVGNGKTLRPCLSAVKTFFQRDLTVAVIFRVNGDDRFAVIEQHWPEILQIIDEEMPSSAAIAQILTAIGAPKTPQDIGIEAEILPRTFMATRDIRDKYVLSRLAWDLGVTDELTVE